MIIRFTDEAVKRLRKLTAFDKTDSIIFGEYDGIKVYGTDYGVILSPFGYDGEEGIYTYTIEKKTTFWKESKRIINIDAQPLSAWESVWNEFKRSKWYEIQYGFWQAEYATVEAFKKLGKAYALQPGISLLMVDILTHEGDGLVYITENGFVAFRYNYDIYIRAPYRYIENPYLEPLENFNVYDHRNIFGTTRLYIENTYPVVIKEISTAPDGKTKHYWYWVFYPDYYVIYHFEKKPTKKEWSKMWTEILDSIESLNARILHKNTEEVRK